RAFLGVGPDQEHEGKGFKIASVAEGSAAEKAKLKVGDTILAVDGKTVDAGLEGPGSLIEILKAYKAGDKVKFHIEREGWERDLTIELGARPAELDQPQENEGGEERREEPAPRTRERDRANSADRPHAWLGI